MPLVFLPEAEALFLWSEGQLSHVLSELEQAGESWTAQLIAPDGLRATRGRKLPLVQSATKLALVPASELSTLSGSLAVWSLASKLALDLLARERVVPTIARVAGRIEARWAAASSASATRSAASSRSWARADPSACSRISATIPVNYCRSSAAPPGPP